MYRCKGNNLTTRNKMKTEIEMTDLETVVLAKVIKEAAEKSASHNLTAGEHNVDISLRIHGSVKKGEDYEGEVVNKIDWTLLCAVLLGKVNEATRKSVVDDYIKMDPKMVEGLKDKAAESVKELKATTKKMQNGKITTKLAISIF
jgi:hypothetical protein